MPLKFERNLDHYGSIRLIKETLSDSSCVYNVHVGSIVFAAIDEAQATRLYDHLLEFGHSDLGGLPPDPFADIKAACPACDTRLWVPPDLPDQLRCPGCDQYILTTQAIRHAGGRKS